MSRKNYIFDLYATLVDIHTNENTVVFRRRAADLLAAYGIIYTPRNLIEAYRKLIRQMEEELSDQLGTDFPEADLGEVFTRLVTDAPEKREGIWGDPGSWKEETLEKWVSSFACSFRVMSRIRFGLYPDTISTLEWLLREGNRVFLLSNAQSLFTRPEMEALGLIPYFEDIFISSEHGMKKPETRYLRKLLEKHGLDPAETVMVGNEMTSDIHMAASCGVNGILVNHDGYSEEEIRKGIEEAGRLAHEAGNKNYSCRCVNWLDQIENGQAE